MISAMTDVVAPRAARTPRGSGVRVDQQPAFVLHATPWRETSLVVDALTRDHGRVALVARGAKRPTSHFRGLLMPFTPLAVGWTGRGETRTLMRADWLGGLVPLRGGGLLAAFYVNELLVRLLERGDAHPRLFGAYVDTLGALAQGDSAETTLRRFELALLRELGVAPSFEQAADGSTLAPHRWYRLDPALGFEAATGGASGDDAPLARGASLLALARHELLGADAQAECRSVLRVLVRYHLEGRPLNTRRILRDLKSL